MPRLLVVTGGAKGSDFELPHSEFTIGRLANCSLVVDERGVSRRHCRIFLSSKEGLQIEDLESRNGTHVNGQRIVGSTTLNDGDEIRVGNVALKFEDSGRAYSTHDELNAEVGFEDEIDSSITGVLDVEQHANQQDEEFLSRIAVKLRRGHVICPDMDSGKFMQDMQDSTSTANRVLNSHFKRILGFDARAGVDESGEFNADWFISHCARELTGSLGVADALTEFHAEDVVQFLKDAEPSLLCFFFVELIPSGCSGLLRSFTQEKHQAMFCGPHVLPGMKMEVDYCSPDAKKLAEMAEDWERDLKGDFNSERDKRSLFSRWKGWFLRSRGS